MSELKSYLCIVAKAIETKDAFGYRFTAATKPAPEACDDWEDRYKEPQDEV